MDLGGLIGIVLMGAALACLVVAIYIALQAKKDNISWRDELTKQIDDKFHHHTATITAAIAAAAPTQAAPAMAAAPARDPDTGLRNLTPAQQQVASAIDSQVSRPAAAKVDNSAQKRDPFAIGPGVVDWLSANHGPVTYDHGRVIKWLVQAGPGDISAAEMELAYQATIVKGLDQSAGDKAIADANAARGSLAVGGLVGIARCSDADGYFLWSMASPYQTATGKNIFTEMLQGTQQQVNEFINAHETWVAAGFDPSTYTGQFSFPVRSRINGG